MANSIELFKNYSTLMDEKLKQEAKTSILDSDAEYIRQGANANELIIQKLDMSGLGKYDKDAGYTDGSITLTNETVKTNFDRSRKFHVDAMDNIETAGVIVGNLLGQFIKTQVVPEVDAHRISTYYTAGTKADAAALSTGANVISALRAGMTSMDDAEVPADGRILFITPTLKGLVDDLDTTKSKAVMDGFEAVVVVPQSRMYTAITQKDGVTVGQEAGGYDKAEGAKNLNFLICQKDAVIQYQKHLDLKVVAPENNPNMDAWLFGYRNVGLADTLENKVAGIYGHSSNT